MITLLILIVLGYIYYRIWTNPYDRGDVGFKMFMTFASTLLTLVASLMVFALISDFYRVESGREECYVKIYSLKNVDGIEGRFCLGSGYIGSQEYYYMYEQYRDGGLHRFANRANDVVIYQNENNTPFLHWQKIHYRLPYWAHMYPKSLGVLSTQDTMYDVHIPTNSVILKYEVR